MRKTALAIVLILVLVGSVVGGVAVAGGASDPTLLVNGGSSAPSRVSISGKNWAPGVPVDLYMDTTDVDEAHHVAVATPDSRGSFLVSFAMGPTTLGDHKIIGVQNSTQVEASFRVTNTQQLDDRTWDVLQDINEEVGNIEGKLDDPAFGLAEIKSEVSDIEADVDLLKVAVNHVAIVNSDSDYRHWTSGEDVILIRYPQIRHVSLTLWVNGGNDGDLVMVDVYFPSAGTWVTLDRIGGGPVAWALPGANGVHTYEFDTDAWDIGSHVGDSPLNCAWNVTTTHPRQMP